MTITIREETVSGDIIFQTTTGTPNNPPEIFFEVGSFYDTDKPKWITNQAILREGNFRHYAGSDDSDFPVSIILTGSSKLTNLATVKSIKDQIIYVDLSDVDSNLTGQYIVDSNIETERDPKLDIIRVKMTWGKYNN